MAVSDPTMDVPTPTGVLQGVAAFNWDGAVWQPAGRAAPSVATPTGNLQGVAAFTGGPSWAPSGRAGPGVATPTGVLDGVAVYTWSGSQWTPPGGTETVPTPTGGLRGVAAFDWDGTAWQPAGQARSSVPTPYGVLDGVARFNWTGTAWAAVGAPSLSLDFMTPGALDSRVTFTRASTATYTDAGGTIQTAAVNAPRWDYANGVLRGLLIEEARTNSCLQSGNVANAAWGAVALGGVGPVTTANQTAAPDGTVSAARVVYPAVATAGFASAVFQGVVASAVPWTFSIWLKGNAGGEQLYIYLSDGAAAYPAKQRVTLTTAWQRFSVTATLTVATWYAEFGTDLRDGGQTSTPAQTVFAWGAQVEAGASATSYIPTTTAAVARAFDNCFLSSANMAPWFVSTAGSWFAEFIDNVPAGGTSPRIIGPNSAGVTPLWASTGLNLSSFDGAVLADPAPLIVVGAVTRGVSAWAAGTGRLCANGGAVFSGAQATGFAALASTGVSFMGGNPGVVNETMTGYMRRVRYWPRALSDAEMQAATT